MKTPTNRMSAKIHQLSDYTDDNRHISPAALLREVADEIDGADEQYKPNKVLVLRLNTKDDIYDVGFSACNINTSEMLGLLEVAKAVVLRQMEYAVFPEDIE